MYAPRLNIPPGDDDDSVDNVPPASPQARSKQKKLMQNMEKVKQHFQRVVDLGNTAPLPSWSGSSLDSQPAESDRGAFLNKSTSILNDICQSRIQTIIHQKNAKKKMKLNVKAQEFTNLTAVQESEESHNSDQDLERSLQNIWNTPATPYPSHTLYLQHEEQPPQDFSRPSCNTYLSLNNHTPSNPYDSSTSFFENFNSSGSNQLDSGRSQKQHSNFSCMPGGQQNNYLSMYQPSQACTRKLKNLFKCQIGYQPRGAQKLNNPLFMNHSTHQRHLNGSRTRKSNHIENEDGRYKICLDKIDEDSRTTLMIANIPNKYTMEGLMQKIDSEDHKDKYDFFYIPVDLEVSAYQYQASMSATRATPSSTQNTPATYASFTRTFTTRSGRNLTLTRSARSSTAASRASTKSSSTSCQPPL